MRQMTKSESYASLITQRSRHNLEPLHRIANLSTRWTVARSCLLELDQFHNPSERANEIGCSTAKCKKYSRPSLIWTIQPSTCLPSTDKLSRVVSRIINLRSKETSRASPLIVKMHSWKQLKGTRKKTMSVFNFHCRQMLWAISCKSARTTTRMPLHISLFSRALLIIMAIKMRLPTSIEVKDSIKRIWRYRKCQTQRKKLLWLLIIDQKIPLAICKIKTIKCPTKPTVFKMCSLENSIKINSEKRRRS